MIPVKLVQNTVALFSRHIVTLAISLYSVRILLQSLGIDDFALFNIILSVVTLGAFLPWSLSTITQRYFSYAIGKKDHEGIRSAHDAVLILCIVMTLLLVVVLETAGLWFVKNHLSVEPGRLATAQILFHLTVASFAVNNICSFYAAVTLAHEDMKVFTWVSIVDSILKLAAAISLSLIDIDSIVLYGIFLLSISCASLVVYTIYCRSKYPECRISDVRFERKLVLEIVRFSGWTIFGQISTIARNQAVTILINQAYSPAVMAARAISHSVTTHVLLFSNNFSTALNPPIIKAHAAGRQNETFKLIALGGKISFFLIWCVTLPLLALTPGVLKLWLGDYPDETVTFIRLGLLEGAILSLSVTLMTAVRAHGHVRLYELILAMLQFMILVFSWIVVFSGYPAYAVYLIAIVIHIVMFFARLFIVRYLIGLSVLAFLRSAVLPAIWVGCASSVLVYCLFNLVPQAEYLEFSKQSMLAAFLIFAAAPITTYAFGITASEKIRLKQMIFKKVRKAA